jgi:VanZ family protein
LRIPEKNMSSEPIHRGPGNLIAAVDEKRHHLKYFCYYWAPVIVYCLLIFYQSAYPSFEHTPDLPYIDKVLHCCGYALLGFLCYRALRKSRLCNRTLLLIFLSALISTLYGVSDEIHQHFVIARHADLMDVAADSVGSLFGAWGAYVFFNRHGIAGR